MNKTPLNSLGEFGLIKHLTQNIELKNHSSIKGVGDDAAIIDNGNLHTVISTDMLVEGIHFDLAYTPLKHLGYKSVVINLSDIYAMNAHPKQITLSLALSNRFTVEALEEFYEGVYLACNKYQVDLVGGDTTSSNKGLIISVTAIGQAEKDKIVYRNTAQVGDIICITGDLGAAYLGLQILEREKMVHFETGAQPDLSKHQYMVERLLKPEARKDIIEVFEKAKLLPTSMIDISDGLASELFHICTQSNVGAYLEESGVPIRQDVEIQSIDFKIDPITCALSGGEDYELLFTCRPEDIEKLRFLPADNYIAGEIVAPTDGIKLHTRGGNIHPIVAQGWNHFN